ncbi:hypothetical protein [Pectobacterium brasiliense]|uniref:hypothetical protein n=1 Tax=Pectobacterium brasiliense TaxID=180957 RepID=UPI0015DF008A|nr:hypothetical protein [Pectobacterium brasiliense]MBA0208365.1 hypothetical protein [Pectobacterium brasiliense]
MEFINEMDLIIGLQVQDGVIPSIDSLSPDALYEFLESLYLSTRYHLSLPVNDNENFSFIANSSLSGGASNCANLECRLSKLDELISFASLYADVIYINNPFEYLYQSWNDLNIYFIKSEIIAAIYQYFYLKPYLSQGIIKYSFGYVSLCEHHHETLAKPLRDRILDKEKELTKIFNEHFLSNCTISLDKYKNGEAFIEIKDSTALLEHGRAYLNFSGEPKSKYLKKLLKNGEKHIFSRDEIEQEGVLPKIVYPLVNDLIEQEWISYFYKSSLLIDNKVKCSLAGMLNKDTMALNSKTFNESIKHYLPTIQSRDPLEIINHRIREEEAFKVYRDKLHKLLINAPKNKPEYISEIFRDTVLPEINLINKKIKDFQSVKIKNLREKLFFGSGVVAIGLYSGILPSNLGNILAAIGGGSAIVSSMIDYKSAFFSKEEARSNDYYFLWNLTK